MLTKCKLDGVLVSDICGEDEGDKYELYVGPCEEWLRHGIIMSIGIVSVDSWGDD